MKSAFGSVVRSYILASLIVGAFLGISLAVLESPQVLADAASTAVDVGNAAPTVANVAITPNPIVLTENTSTTITITADITDANGCGDVFTSGTLSAVLYRTGVSGTSSCSNNALNCYRNITMADAGGTCTGGADTSGTASGTIKVWYFADATDASSTFPSEWWAAYVLATDESAATGNATSSATVELNSLYALDVTASINYGAVPANTDTGSTNQVATTTNTGNYNIDIEFSGTNMASGGDTLLASQQKYGTSSAAYASLTHTLSTSPTARNINVGRTTTSTSQTASTTYWGIAVPGGQPTGSYTGSNTFTAIFGD